MVHTDVCLGRSKSTVCRVFCIRREKRENTEKLLPGQLYEPHTHTTTHAHTHTHTCTHTRTHTHAYTYIYTQTHTHTHTHTHGQYFCKHKESPQKMQSFYAIQSCQFESGVDKLEFLAPKFLSQTTNSYRLEFSGTFQEPMSRAKCACTTVLL